MRGRLFRLIIQLVGALVLAGAAVVLLYNAGRTLTHPARTAPARTPSDVGINDWINARMVTLDGVTIEGWFIPPLPIFRETTVEKGATLIYAHDLGGNRGSLLDEAARLRALDGYGALLIDLRAHGSSGGDVSTFGDSEALDIGAALDYLRDRTDVVNLDRIGVFGDGIGASAAIQAAVSLPGLRVVVAQAPHAESDQVYMNWLERRAGTPILLAPLTRLVTELLGGTNFAVSRPVAYIRQLDPRPLLLLNGELDPIIPPAHSLALADAADYPIEQVLFPTGAHGSLWVSNPEMWERRVGNFLRVNLRNAS